MTKSGHLHLVFLFAAAGLLYAEPVNWNGPSGSKIKQVRYLRQTPPQQLAAAQAETAVSNVIDSPPIDGFVPWVAVTVTRESLDAETTGIYDAFPSSYVGTPPSGKNPRTSYFIAIFDTGASAHVISYQNAVRAGLYNSTYLTNDNFVSVAGVTGAVDAHVTWPYAVFVSGLDALEPNAPGQTEMVLPATAGMLGEYNVATLIGQNPGSNPDLATAIGTPLSVFYDTHIRVDQPITATCAGVTYTGPTVTLYEKGEGPSYPNYVPMELKPSAATNVQYITYGFDPEDLMNMFSDLFSFEMDYSPITPSVVMGVSSQSLFFFHGVDLVEGSRHADDKNRFMLDTGAQVTVIGSRVAARLGLQPANKDFVVQIQGVDGQSIDAPGFYIDALTIPAVGDWLQFTNVPVVMLDIFSPEGGTLDGILGMNLFTQYNLVLRAGGFMLEDDPRLEFQRIAAGPVTGDIAPQTRDYRVDLQDFSVFSSAWMSSTSSPNWNADADLAAPLDGTVNLPDMLVLADNWLMGVVY
ncbi:MAG: retroviral-like aspartic protease family protein [Planctomycetaceae bacterium]|nr:retroviral-like aspartic protease family protein [Planctomycetaceae bacterium]